MEVGRPEVVALAPLLQPALGGGAAVGRVEVGLRAVRVPGEPAGHLGAVGAEEVVELAVDLRLVAGGISIIFEIVFLSRNLFPATVKDRAILIDIAKTLGIPYKSGFL